MRKVCERHVMVLQPQCYCKERRKKALFMGGCNWLEGPVSGRAVVGLGSFQMWERTYWENDLSWEKSCPVNKFTCWCSTGSFLSVINHKKIFYSHNLTHLISPNSCGSCVTVRLTNSRCPQWEADHPRLSADWTKSHRIQASLCVRTCVEGPVGCWRVHWLVNNCLSLVSVL